MTFDPDDPSPDWLASNASLQTRQLAFIEAMQRGRRDVAARIVSAGLDPNATLPGRAAMKPHRTYARLDLAEIVVYRRPTSIRASCFVIAHCLIWG